MAGFGGAVKLTGASEYKKALSSITQELKVVSAQMKATSSEFANGDMKEKDLIRASKEMKASLDDQKKALASLKNELDQMNAELKKSEQAHNDLIKEYNSEKDKLDEIGRTLGETSEEYDAQAKAVADLAIQVQKSEKSLDSQTKAVQQMTIQTANAETTCNQTAKAIDDMGKKAEESTGGFTVMKGVLANLATDVIRTAIDGLKKLGEAFIDVGKEAYSSYAEFEQLEGGVKKIFGDDMAQVVMENAQNAFRTAGLSANDYMETVTGFSASLIQSLGGDTQQATEVADRAIRDMSDNANTFGTSMDSIIHAYQNFAKGNFTLLDNLKIGYGGTKEEAERLVAEASQMTDIMEQLGVTVDADDLSFANIANAISVVQANMGIMNTTAREAEGTIQGSTASMRSAWQNLLTGMADADSDFETLTSNFMSTLISEDGQGGVLGNMIPRITQVIDGMSQAIQTLLPQLMSTIAPLIEDGLPQITSAVNGIIRSLISLLPQIVSTLADLIPQIVSELLNMIPQLSVAGIQIITTIIDGISQAIPTLMGMLPDVIADMIEIFVEWLPDIISTGETFLMSLIDGFMSAVPKLIADLPRMVTQIVDGLLSSIPQIIDAGINLFMALVENLPVIIQGIVQALPQIITGIINGIMKNLPAIVNAGVQLFTALVTNIPAIVMGIVRAIPQIIEGIITGFEDAVPAIMEAGDAIFGELWDALSYFFTTMIPEALSTVKAEIMEWWNGIADFISQIPSKIGEIIDNAITFVRNIPHSLGVILGEILGTIIKFNLEVAEWVRTKIPEIIDAVTKYFESLPSRIWEWLSNTYERIKQFGIDSVNKAKETGENFIKNLIDVVKTLPEKLWEWLLHTYEKVTQFVSDISEKAKEGAETMEKNLLDGLSELPSKIFEVGKNIVEGLWNGITSMGDWLKEKMGEFADGILEGMKDALGIESPSKVFRDEVGKYIAQGVGVGFEEEMKNISKDMQSAIPTSFDGNVTVGSNNYASMNGFAVAEMVGAFKEALSEVKIEMDDEQMGRFVDKTVTNLVYS